MATTRSWTAAAAIFLFLGAASLASAQFTFLTPGDPRVITAVVDFEKESTVNGRDNYVVSVQTTQNDEILGKASFSEMTLACSRERERERVRERERERERENQHACVPVFGLLEKSEGNDSGESK